jgi:hypothetical protein
MKRIALLLLATGLATPPALAEPAGLPREVQVILQTRCVECHGGKAVKGRLTLATPAGLARGGRSGAAVRPGQPDASLLWKKVRDEEMPPEAPLPSAERQVLQKWIASGAPGLPAGVGPHWAFGPPRRPAVPAATQPGLRNAVDRFIAAALDEKKRALAPEADRLTLLRRIAFDLTGLPPTPEEIAAFGADDSPGACERMVEHFLASPHYGERWGKFWLDAALVLDLERRGLLDSTIVLWTGEFGRLPVSQGSDGRDHNRHAFSLWLAGGGFKRGYVHGATDDFSYRAAADVVRVCDLHATLLHALGLDHRQLTFPHDGRSDSLTDVDVTKAHVVPALLA